MERRLLVSLIKNYLQKNTSNYHGNHVDITQKEENKNDNEWLPLWLYMFYYKDT